MIRNVTLHLCCLALFIIGTLTRAGQSSETVSYWDDIRPIFQAHCHGCHQPAKPSGQYVMTDRHSLIKGGESGEPAIVPGRENDSYLFEQIRSENGMAAMPQDQPPLTDQQISMVAAWISGGAIDDTPKSSKSHYDVKHPPVYLAPPVISSLAFSPDGTTLAVSGYHEVLLHDVARVLSRQPGETATKSLVARLVGISERIESAVFSPRGSRLAVAGGSPGRLGEVQVWDLDPQRLHLSIPVTYDTCFGASWSSDGGLIAVGCPDNTVRAFDSATGKQVVSNSAHNDWVLDTAFSIDSKHLVTVSRDRSLKLIEVATERFVDNISRINADAARGGLGAIDRHPTENHVSIGGSDGVVKILRVFLEDEPESDNDPRLVREFPAMPGRIVDVTFSQDGKQLVASSYDNGAGFVYLFETKTANVTHKLPDVSAAVYCVAISPNGKWIASGGFAGEVQIHSAKTGQLVCSFVPVNVTSNAELSR